MVQALAAFNARRYAEAELLCQFILASDDSHFDALHTLGVLCGMRGRPDLSLSHLSKALGVRPDSTDANWHMAIALVDLKRPDDALASLDRTLELQPDHLGALINRGNLLQEQGQPEAALASFDRAMALNPEFPVLRYNESLCRLQLGDFEHGWRGHEWRWQVDQLDKLNRNFTQPLWLGEESLAGKTILLYAEQGLGDTLQFLRYAKLVAALGATVLLEVQPWLKALLGGIEGIEGVFGLGEPLPAFDYHCPLLSLPLAFKTSLESIPAQVPYIRSDPLKADLWGSRLGDTTQPRIGLVWSGRTTHKNDQNRSIPLAVWSGLVSKQVQLISLQRELRASDKQALQARPDIRYLGDELKDFADTAAVIDLMDLVITVDTAVAHLAAAMGKPVWVLLPFNPDWRWLLNREDSPWYPTVRLFRQTTRGDWANVLVRVKDALDQRFGAGFA